MPQYSLDDLKNMTPEERNNVLLRAQKIEATVLVRDANGIPKYDDAARAGSYGEENLDARNG